MAKVVVAGAIATDAILVVDHHPLAGEELASRGLTLAPGGKGLNQAVAAARAGAEVLMMGCVGRDAFAQQIIEFLEGEGIRTGHVQMLDEGSTDLAFIMVDPGGERTIIYSGQCMPQLSFDGLDRIIESGDVLVSQAELAPAMVTEYFAKGRRIGSYNVLNAAPVVPIDVGLLGLADIVVVNKHELAVSAGLQSYGSVGKAAVEAAAVRLRTFNGQTVIVTLGAEGALICTASTTIYIDALPVKVVDSTGAGDAFAGSLAACLSVGWPIERAARYACAAGSLAATRKGAGPAMPFRSEVEDALGSSSDDSR